MIITCSRCGTRYDVPVDALGTAGRPVRCSHCGHQWTQTPPLGNAVAARLAAVRTALPAAKAEHRESAAKSPSPPQLAAVVPATPKPEAALDVEAHGERENETVPGGTDAVLPVTADTPDQPADVEATPPPSPVVEVEEAAAAEATEPLPAALREPDTDRQAQPGPGGRHRKRWLVAAAVATVLVVCLAGLMLGREQVVAAFPGTSVFYAAIGLDQPPGAGLDIRDVTSARDENKAGEILVVQGVVANPGDVVRTVPMIRIALFDAADGELQAVTVAPDNATLRPGQSIPFTATVEGPDPLARRVKVTFVPRRRPT